MKVKIAEMSCSLETWGTIMDCDPMICFLCKYHRPSEYIEEIEVTPKELVDLIKSFHYVIKGDDGQASA